MRYRTFLEPDAKRDVDSYVKIISDKWNISFKIADCNRTVTLLFPLETIRDIEISRAKLNKLQVALNHITAELTKAEKGIRGN